MKACGGFVKDEKDLSLGPLSDVLSQFQTL